ncbi:MAG: ATP-binding protein [Chloroflexota bacterium]
MNAVLFNANQQSESHPPLSLLEIPTDDRFDRITRLAAQVCHVPMALIVLVKADHLDIKAWYGQPESPGDYSFCGDLILKAADRDLVCIPDLQLDPQLAEHPLVTGQPNLRFYAGVAVSTPIRGRVGALCVLDTQPHHFTPDDVQTLRDLATGLAIEIDTVDLQQRFASYSAESERMESDLTLARDQALEASQLKSEFLANMSHEIRTPMTAVIGMAELLEQSALNEDQHKMIEVIRSSSEALMTIINDILDFSKIEAGKLALESLDFILSDIIASTLDLLISQARSKGLTILTTVDKGIPKVLVGDSMRLRQILLNLLSNAIKFTEQGQITLDAFLESSGTTDVLIRFNVIDTGIGLTTEDKSQLFKPFSQANGSTTRRFGGSGLGLAICQRLVEMMGGKIGVDSEPNQGSTFWFTVQLKLPTNMDADDIATMRGLLARAVPNRAVPESAVAAHLNHQDAAKPADRPLILLVEDNIVNQELASLHLERLGYAVEAVSTGEEALTAVDKKPYVLVLMDCMMPGMDGLETTRQIRKREADTGKRIPIVALTANAMQGDRARCLAAGMDDYLAKPIDFKLLLSIIQQWAGLSPDPVAVQPVSSESRSKAISTMAFATLDSKTFNNLRKLYNQSDSRFMGRSIETFLDNSGKMLKALRSAVEHNELTEIYRLAHTLKSGSASYGAVRFSGMCKTLEGEAREGTFTDLFQQLEQIEIEYEKVALALKAEQDKESQ